MKSEYCIYCEYCTVQYVLKVALHCSFGFTSTPVEALKLLFG